MFGFVWVVVKEVDHKKHHSHVCCADKINSSLQLKTSFLITMSTMEGYPNAIFVGIVPEKYNCPVCLNIMKEPHQCKNGHNYCLSCITTALEVNRECPTCKTYLDLDRLSRNLMVRDDINELATKCVNGSCDWTGRLEAHQTHLDKCEHQEIDCPLFLLRCCGEGCTGKHLRDVAKSHIRKQASNQKQAEETIKLMAIKLKRQAMEIGMYQRMIKNEFVPENPEKRNFGTLKYYFGGNLKENTYIGGWSNEANGAHGFGVTRYNSSKTVHTGNYVNGKKHGFGVYETETYSYTGMFFENAITGKGTRKCFKSGDTFVGNFVNGVKQGKGLLTNSVAGRDMSWIGNWVDGRIHGDVQHTNPHGVVIQQHYVNGV
jgi:hypothetical protein